MAAVVGALRAMFAPYSFAIEQETPADVVAREVLLDRVMGPGRRRKSSEILRRSRVPAEGLAFVARSDSGGLIGTVRLWNIEAGINQLGNPVDALLLGPLAVDENHAGKGIGSALMRAAIAGADKNGHGAVLLVGDADYYGRFGFSGGLAQSLVMPGPFERARFVALELKEGWLAGAAGILTPSGKKLQQKLLCRAA